MTKSMELSKNSITKELEDLGISYVVEHRKVKYARVEFKSENQLLIKLPLKMKKETEILVKDRKWIKKKLGDIKSAIKSVEDYKKSISDDTKILLFGEFYQIIKSNGKYNIRTNNHNLHVSVPKDQAHLSYLRKWLRMELKRIISTILHELSMELNVNYHNIVVKSQKSKWGSCSSKGNLNFNLRLIALPSELIKYVALHELIHINNMS